MRYLYIPALLMILVVITLLMSALLVVPLVFPFAGDVIAFVGNGGQNTDIFLLDLKTKKALNLTRSPQDETRPVWSPDGQALAFVSTIGNNPQVFVIEAGSRTLQPLQPDSQDFTGVQYRIPRPPVWLPDGRHLVFVRVGLPGNPSLFYRANVITGEIENIDQGDPDAQYYLETSLFVDYPSPDGSQVLYYSFVNEEWTLHIDEGSRSRLLYRFLRRELLPGDTPTWSPDGRQIAFVLVRENIPQIHLIDANGGTPKRLTTIGSANPVWQPR